MPRRKRKPNVHRQFLNTHRHRYDELLGQQAGGCWICGRPPSERRRLDIDHDHKLMFIRGLLCVRCNRALHQWMTAEWLERAAAYLRKGAV